MMAEPIERMIGPRVPAQEWRAHWVRYLIPTLLFVAAAVLLIVSIFQPYWRLTLHAPQYPKGLAVQAYLNRLEGDVREIDGLNHYIGMRPLNEAAQFERSISIIGVAAVALLILAAIFVHTKWAALLALPALLFPAIFLVDLQYWLANFGQNLDPHAPLSSSVKPFVPPVLFEGQIAQFRTVAMPEIGLWLAVAASVLIMVALFFHRRAYKPLVDAQQA
jgi:copper chaperone NosL